MTSNSLNNNESQISKSPSLILTFFMLWSLCIIIYGPKLLLLINEGENIGKSFILISFCILFIFFWSLGSYYTSILLFSFFTKDSIGHTKELHDKNDKIAILYPTCDDFQREAILTCLNQNYSNCHTFILDDSSSKKFQDDINKFHKEFVHNTTLIRRTNKKGFKAGNLNNALKEITKDYPYFVVVDADERLPIDFVEKTLSKLKESNYAFVQANHRPNPNQNSKFSKDLSNTIIPFWQVHCSLRNKYGLVIFVGHGALIKSEAWKKVGGFPEFITEDLAFSFELRGKGFHGYFIEDLICYEDFPTDYNNFRKQQERYITGTTQVLHYYIPQIFKNKTVSLIEKIDLLLWCLPLYVPAFVFLILLVGGLGLFLFFGEWRNLDLTLMGRQYSFIIVRKITLHASSLDTIDFKLFSIICSLSPIFTSIYLGYKKKIKVGRLIFLSTVPYLSLMLMSWKNIFSYIFLKKVSFPSTGSYNNMSEKNKKVKWFYVFELIFALVLSVISILSLNLGYLAVSSCMVIGFILRFVSWDKKIIEYSVLGCFSLILIQMVISLFTLLPSDSMIPLIFSVHF